MKLSKNLASRLIYEAGFFVYNIQVNSTVQLYLTK